MAKRISIVKQIQRDFDIRIEESDLYKANNEIYISTGKVAELFSVGVHHFSNFYIKPLLSSGVRRVTIGRNKYYCLKEIYNRLKKSIEKDKSILEICGLMKFKKRRGK